jgi:hypothetical protein
VVNLVIVVKHMHLPRTIKEIQQISEKFNLKFNACKSNWIRAKKNKGKKLSLEETFNVEEALN